MACDIHLARQRTERFGHMWMKRRILRLKLRLPCFSASAEQVDEEFEKRVSDGFDIEGSVLQDDHGQEPTIGSDESVALEYRDPKKLTK